MRKKSNGNPPPPEQRPEPPPPPPMPPKRTGDETENIRLPGFIKWQLPGFTSFDYFSKALVISGNGCQIVISKGTSRELKEGERPVLDAGGLRIEVQREDSK